jgi:hypothetical protein
MEKLSSCGALSALEREYKQIWHAGGLVFQKTGLEGVWDVCTNPVHPGAITRFYLVHLAGQRVRGDDRKTAVSQAGQRCGDADDTPLLDRCH